MSYLEKEREQEEIQKLLAQELAEDSAPDFIQYGFLKWGKGNDRQGV